MEGGRGNIFESPVVGSGEYAISEVAGGDTKPTIADQVVLKKANERFNRCTFTRVRFSSHSTGLRAAGFGEDEETGILSNISSDFGVGFGENGKYCRLVHSR